MKFISWNVNGLRAAMKKGFADFFREQDADFFALQETKMQPEQLEDAMKFEGYHMYMNSAERKGYSGTLIYTKHEPLSVTYEIEGDDTKEGRVITLEYPDFYFVCAYVPNSKDGLLRLPYRIEWEEMLRKHLGFSDEERAAMTKLLGSGFSDTFRELYPDTQKFSWWSYRMKARERNVGWRIDYFLVSQRLLANVQDALIFDETEGSDHCPVGLNINL